MGHYYSEMHESNSTPKSTPPKTSDIPLEDRVRRKKRLHGPMEAGERQEFAVDYDEWDGEWKRPGETSEDHARPIREGSAPDLKTCEYVASIRMYGDRPAQILRRTVTYGEWEVVGETSGKATAWY